MSLLDRVKQSKAWDARYNLPLYPAHNNPFIYAAYMFKLAKDSGDDIFDRAIFLEHLSKCEKEHGLFNRWPHGGDMTSHDELIGISYLSVNAAVSIVHYLVEHDGNYNNTGEAEPHPLRYNLFRFFWLMPYLKACANMEVGIHSQLLYSANLIADLAWKSDGVSGKLLLWLMNERMEKYFICRIAIYVWRKFQKPIADMFTEYFPEEPIYSELAKI